MTQPPDPEDDGTLSTGLATVQVVQQDDGSATLVVNGTDLSKAASRAVLDVDGRGPARVSVWLKAGLSFEGAGVVTLVTPAPASSAVPGVPVEDVVQMLADLPWQQMLTEAMRGSLDDVPADLLRDLVLEEVSTKLGGTRGD